MVKPAAAVAGPAPSTPTAAGAREPASPRLVDDRPPASAISPLSAQRLNYIPALPEVLKGAHSVTEGEERECVGNHDEICGLFPRLSCNCERPLRMVNLTAAPAAGPDGPHAAHPLRIGVVLSGGQASGGHNVIIGLHDYLQRWHPGSTLVGFLNGPRGVMQNNYKELSAAELDGYRNQGGFHMIGSGRDKIEKPEQLAAAEKACTELHLDGLVVIGGDDSNTNAAVLAEHFLARGVSTRVVGAPKTIDGDLKNADVPISFGFDTACKVEVVGNIMIDAMSAKKYYHFIRLMGRAASHITLECALQTHPQLALVSEEVEANQWGLKDVLADMVAQRAEHGKNYGVVLIPEGGWVFYHLPAAIRSTLLEERDPHGNVQVAHIETEWLLIKMVAAEMARRKARGQFGGKFAALSHYFGYEGRCSLPSNFDATYCNALGQAAGCLVAAGQTGLMATVSNLHCPVAEWSVGGTPLLSMMHLERRSGRDKPVIKKALVELDGAPMQARRRWRGSSSSTASSADSGRAAGAAAPAAYTSRRAEWAAGDCFRSPGPIQFAGRCADLASATLSLELNGGRTILLTGEHDA
ncbi:pyrophosphate-fructose 6-phosphate 1-phosphotransferase subunit beta 1 [Micractinium conductrix]|uniref:Pyrophosphate-fructose 6-phosphate 1-phosphotransferase subunit beta 1 n=1 Tax=Micractinium conductrix TaxID=554055 RepID=A0A2P6VBI9_9CHLO|nr:pyrophosphate-fructose 6-phosphate 1-phosphotransferase subunit beta 1 [Micractinium conductrix]|eukprot:PSC71449.1 pyrophosphate-fructose 6-phosphate 1-phosphotransferase subunit beta 1 [Micractinium conductrix]